MLLLKTSRETLLAPLQTVSGIVEKRHTLPILSNVLIEKKGAMLTLVATDIEIQITTGVSLEGGAEGSVTVAARKLQDILRSLPEESTVSLDLDEKRLVVKAGKSRFSLQTLPAEDFPQMNMNAANPCRLPSRKNHSSICWAKRNTRWPHRMCATTSTACCCR